MRKFFLLLTESYDRQYNEDWRFYLLISALVPKDNLPEAGKLFPVLQKETTGEFQDEVDDEVIFRQVAAELVPGR